MTSLSRSIPGAVALAVVLVLGACGREAPEDADEVPAGGAPATEAALPDTTPDAVWAYLQEQNYTSWPMWPGTSALYAGTEPHGMLLTTYVNPVMQRALESGSTTGLPDGAVVVKENYMPDSTLAAVTAMYQPTGNYDESAGGWWYLKRNTDGTIDAAGGTGTMCQQCHQGAEGGDYLYTALPGEMGAN